MDNSCEHARELMAGAWMKDPDEASIAELRHHLDACAACAAEWEALGGMWEKLGDLPVPEPSLALRARWEQTLGSLVASREIGPAHPRAWWQKIWPANPAWQMAIAGLCLMIGLAAGAYLQRDAVERDEVARLRDEVASTKEMVAVSLLQQQSAAERLRGVDYSERMPSMEPRVVAALIQAVNRDSNVNVRLAAIDALGKVANESQVRQSMQEALTQQDSPMVQAALIDYLVDAHDRNAVRAIGDVAARPGVNPTVRQRAAMAVVAMTPKDYKLEDREPLHHTFAGDKTIDVELVNGSLSVIGDGGSTMRVDAERVIHAATQDQMARAKKDDVLDLNEKDGVAQIYENGPFRNNNDHSSDYHGFHEDSTRQYEVAWNVTVHVPRATALKLRTVNGGVAAQDTSGVFDVRSVNGALSMTDVSGSGTASAVNGTNTVSFHENPKADSAFTSVNGKIEVTFQPGLSADFDLKTLNGGMFTDFESTALASTAGTATKENGRFVYKTRGESRIRIGAGGPQIRLETVNGGIQIRKAK